MKRLAWVLGLAPLATLVTAGVMRMKTQSRIEAADRRALAARTRIAQLGAIKLKVDTYQAWKQDSSSRQALIDEPLLEHCSDRRDVGAPVDRKPRLLFLLRSSPVIGHPFWETARRGAAALTCLSPGTQPDGYERVAAWTSKQEFMG